MCHVLWWHLSKVNTLCRIWRTLSGSLDIMSAFAKIVREQIASKTCLLLKVYLGQQPSVFFWCRSQKARAHDSKGQRSPTSVSGWKYSCLKIYLMLLKQFHKGINLNSAIGVGPSCHGLSARTPRCSWSFPSEGYGYDIFASTGSHKWTSALFGNRSSIKSLAHKIDVCQQNHKVNSTSTKQSSTAS